MRSFAARCAAAVPLALFTCGDALSAGPAPLVLYTDIVSGPNSGGESNKGIYLSVFGKNFGGTGPGATTKVYLGDAEVDNYRYLGPSKGRQDIQQITVQIGALGNVQPGTSLPVNVVVNGVSSNSDFHFIVNPGRILFVDNVSGNDATAVIGDISKPFRYVQLDPNPSKGVNSTPGQLEQTAWAQVRPGDCIVMRGRGKPWTDAGIATYFVRFQPYPNASPPRQMGLPPTGAVDTGPICLMGFPGEEVFIRKEYEPSHYGGAISSANKGYQSRGAGAWVAISNLRVESGREDGVINPQAGSLNTINGGNWRVVNNELSAVSATANLQALGGGIDGDGVGHVFLGNYIHDIYHGPDDGRHLQNHGIYISSTGSYEIAYNRIERVRGGNGIQLYSNGTSGSPFVDNVSIHHNVIRRSGKHGVNVADGSRSNIVIWNNVIADTDQCGIRLNSGALREARILNNTVYNTDMLNTYSEFRAALCNDEKLMPEALRVQNNIFVPGKTSRKYVGGTVGFGGRVGTISHNLWSGGAGTVIGNNNVMNSPLFVDPPTDLHLRPGSPATDAGTGAVSSVVLDDFDTATPVMTRTLRPNRGVFDIGAYER